MARMRGSDPAAEDELLKGIPGYAEDNDIDTGANDDLGGDQQQDDADGAGDVEPQQRQQVDDTDDAPEPKIDPKTGKPVVEEPKDKPRYDQHGNVIDAKGNVVAPAGKFRRLEETNKRFKGLLDESNKQVATLRGQLAEQTYLNGAPAKLGLSNEETAIGLDLVALFKRSPEEAVTTILAEAAARGVDLGKVLGNQSAVNTQAITAMLDKRLGPLDQERKQNEQRQKIETDARTRYNTFLTTYPDAEIHQEAIANLMAKGTARDETVGYFMLKEFATRNGFDFEQPLGPQIAARTQNPNQQRQQRQQGRQQQQRPMADGRQVDRQATARSTAIASPDRSFASIIDETLAENGIR